MSIRVLKHAEHLRVKPLSIADRRAALIPLTSIRPIKQHARPILPKPQTRQLLPTAQRTSVKRVQAVKGGVRKPVESALNFAPLRGSKANRVLIIVANGPTHSMAALDRLKDHPRIDIMSINKPDMRLWPTTFWTFCDNSQLRRHRNLWEQYRGIIFNTSSIKEQRAGPTYKARTLNNLGFSTDMTQGVHIGRTTTYVGMQIGFYLGYDHIFVFGCDMCAVDGKLYPWGSNPDVADKNRAKRFNIEARSFEWAATNLSQDIRSRFTFCSEYNPYEFSDKFRRLPHKEAVDIALEHANILLEK